MVTFVGGPADSNGLSLSRAPVFLRVTMNALGKIDALDQLDDTPTKDEQIFVYKLVKDEGGAFVDGRNQKTGKRYSYFTKIAQYKLYFCQPDDATMLDNAKWQAWVAAEDQKSRGVVEDEFK